LKRWREVRERAAQSRTKHFPCDDIPATRLVIAAKLQGKDAHRLSLEFGARCGSARRSLPIPLPSPRRPSAAGLDAAALPRRRSIG